MFCYEQNFFYVLSTLSTLHYHYKINKGRHLEGFDDPGLDLLCQGLGGPPLLLPLSLRAVHQEDNVASSTVHLASSSPSPRYPRCPSEGHAASTVVYTYCTIVHLGDTAASHLKVHIRGVLTREFTETF